MEDKLTKRRFIQISASALIAVSVPSISKASSKDQIIKWQGEALGSIVEIKLVSNNPAQAKQTITQAVSEVKRLENIFSIYNPDSEISQLNGAGELTNPSHEFIDILEVSSEISERTKGYFDPTVQTHWHPERGFIKSGIKNSHTNIKTSKSRINLLNNNKITLNGIAQGYITDKVKEILHTAGYQNALIDIGETYALGNKVQKSPWKIALQGQKNPIELANMAVATSSNISNGFTIPNHILNPLNQKASQKIKYCSVISPSASIADAISTATIATGDKKIIKKFYLDDLNIEIII
jgi:thiamine biosynthesis lipoprotein